MAQALRQEHGARSAPSTQHPALSTQHPAPGTQGLDREEAAQQAVLGNGTRGKEHDVWGWTVCGGPGAFRDQTGGQDSP